MFSGLMFQSFLLAQEPHYDFWTLVSNGLRCSPTEDPSCVLKPDSNGRTDGVIYYDGEYASNGNYDLYISKHFWTLKKTFRKLCKTWKPVTSYFDVLRVYEARVGSKNRVCVRVSM
ncbi:hypothetical protein ARMSODRAFT_956249, partial [Armillaria solidipes]